MRRPTVTNHVSRLTATAVAACLVFVACAPGTETTDDNTPAAEVEVTEHATTSAPTTTSAAATTTSTSEPAEPATTTSSSTTTTVTVPDLTEELSEFEDLEALLDELDDLLADL